MKKKLIIFYVGGEGVDVISTLNPTVQLMDSEKKSPPSFYD